MCRCTCMQVGRRKYDEKEAENVTNHAFRLIIGGSGLWMFGSVLNVSQVYERVDTRVQFMQKMVSIPFLMSSTLFLVCGILGAGNFPYPPAVIKARVLPLLPFACFLHLECCHPSECLMSSNVFQSLILIAPELRSCCSNHNQHIRRKEISIGIICCCCKQATDS
jgi:hypothetical protein